MKRRAAGTGKSRIINVIEMMARNIQGGYVLPTLNGEDVENEYHYGNEKNNARKLINIT